MPLLHINWSACGDWHAARAKLQPFADNHAMTLYGNFAEALVKSVHAEVWKIEALGFVSECEPYWPSNRHLEGAATLVRLSDIKEKLDAV